MHAQCTAEVLEINAPVTSRKRKQFSPDSLEMRGDPGKSTFTYTCTIFTTYLLAEFISFSWRMKYATVFLFPDHGFTHSTASLLIAGLGETQANKPKDLNFMAPYFLSCDTAALGKCQEAYDDLREPFTIPSIQMLKNIDQFNFFFHSDIEQMCI